MFCPPICRLACRPKYSISLCQKQSPFYVRSDYSNRQGRVAFFRTGREKNSYMEAIREQHLLVTGGKVVF